MDAFYKQLLFVMVSIGVMALLLPAEARSIIGNFAIGWVLADIAIKIFPREEKQ